MMVVPTDIRASLTLTRPTRRRSAGCNAPGQIERVNVYSMDRRLLADDERRSCAGPAVAAGGERIPGDCPYLLVPIYCLLPIDMVCSAFENGPALWVWPEARDSIQVNK